MVGIPRGLFYYYYGNKWKYFFDKLDIPYMVSPRTNNEIKKLGNEYSNDEMCLSLKNYIGHVMYLSDKCDYILVPRIDNYGRLEQTCTNFLAAYDIINNLVSNEVIDYNICMTNGFDEYKGFFKLGKFFNKTRSEIKDAYIYADVLSKKDFKKKCIKNINNLSSSNKKILIVSHPYNTYDSTIGCQVISYLEGLGCTIIYSDLFDKNECSLKSSNLSSNLYWKFSKEIIGSIELCKDRIDGIVFLSTFPCGLDSLVNEYIIRKIDKKCLNIIIDDMDSFAGFETRLESFVDILV